MSTPDIRLLAVAGPPVVPIHRILDACRAAEQGGITAVQLRWKAAPAGRLLRMTEALVGVLSVPVYVNDRADVAWLGGARGVHLGADDMPPEGVRRIAPPPFAIGVSVGTAKEAAQVCGADVDYWSIGPVYTTATKPDAGTPIGIAGFKALAARAPAGVPVIAIGGIDASNAADVFESDASGIAASSAIFGEHDIEEAAKMLKAVVDEHLPPPPVSC